MLKETKVFTEVSFISQDVSYIRNDKESVTIIISRNDAKEQIVIDLNDIKPNTKTYNSIMSLVLWHETQSRKLSRERIPPHSK